MMQLSEIMLNFVASFVNNIRQHRGELLSFYPSENLENSSGMGKSLKGCSSCSCIYSAHPLVESAHIYPCRCELISFFMLRVFQNLLTKNVKKAHTSLCVSVFSRYHFITVTDYTKWK